jgi:methyl-accepting chemotaxis protein
MSAGPLSEKIRQWLTPPIQDKELRRKALALNVIALGGLILSLAINSVLFFVYIQRRPSLSNLFLVLLVVTAVWFASIFIFSRRNRVTLASHIFLWGGMAIVLLGTLADPAASIGDQTWYLLTPVVVGAVLLLGSRWGFLFAAVGCLVYLGAALGQYFGLVYPQAPPLPLADIPFEMLLMIGVLFLLATLAWLFESGLQQALQRARSHASELEQARDSLEQTRRYLEQTIERTVADYTTFARRVAEGDLASRLEPAAIENEPLAALGHSLNSMVEALHRLSQQVRQAVEEITALAADILAATRQQALGAEQQASAIAQTSATIDEVRVIAEETTQRAQSVADAAQQTAAISTAGQQAVEQAIDGTRQVRQRVEAISANIQDLSEQTRLISQIIATVSEITYQSDMLALNAAIEAARAGEAGRGFAVVAEEIRRLAEQSQAATDQVRQLLSDIRRRVQATAVVTEEGLAQADQAVELAGHAGEAIAGLTRSIAASSQAAVQIAAAAGQQLSGMEQIAQAMEEINQVARRSEAGAQQMEQAAGELNRLAQRLRRVIEGAEGERL